MAHFGASWVLFLQTAVIIVIASCFISVLPRPHWWGSGRGLCPLPEFFLSSEW